MLMIFCVLGSEESMIVGGVESVAGIKEKLIKLTEGTSSFEVPNCSKLLLSNSSLTTGGRFRGIGRLLALPKPGVGFDTQTLDETD